jgi:hypothetical protein
MKAMLEMVMSKPEEDRTEEEQELIAAKKRQKSRYLPKVLAVLTNLSDNPTTNEKKHAIKECNGDLTRTQISTFLYNRTRNAAAVAAPGKENVSRH